MAKLSGVRLNRILSSASRLVSALLCGSLVVTSSASADIAVIVNPKNLSLWTAGSHDQVKDIFLGTRERFPDGTMVKPVDQRQGAVRQEFYLKLTGKDESALNVYWSNLIFTGRGERPKIIGTDEDVKKSVKENLNNIGYIDNKLVDDSIKVVYVLK